MVTEDDIKKIVLRYLKNYYKFRPRGEGGTISLLDMRTAGGIIADGYMTFKKEDGTDFLATFEATSGDTREEVVYTYRYWFLIWDMLLGASILTTLIVAGNYYGARFTLAEVGIQDYLIAITLILIAFATLIAMIIRKSSKYRYIYAVQQFKEYHADNQWVAISTDVFPHTEDLKFRELKTQCIYNGFGLIMVNNELEPHFVVTPSRTDLFGKRRRTAEFLTESQLMKKVTQNKFAGVFGKMFKKTFKKVPKFKMATTAKERAKAYVSQLRKYKKTAYPQIAGTSLMLTAIAGIFFLEMLNAEYVKFDEKHYLKEREIAKFQEKTPPETTDYMVDSANIVPFNHSEEYMGIDDEKEETPAPEPEEQEPVYEFTELPEQQPTGEVKPDPEPTTKTASTPTSPPTNENTIIDTLSKTGVGIYSPDIASHFVIYDCTRFLNFTGKQYLIQESYHPDLVSAKARILFLAEYSISSNYLWMGCFSDTHNGYIVFVDYLYNDKQEAKENARGYQLDLKRKEIFLEPMRIKTLQISE